MTTKHSWRCRPVLLAGGQGCGLQHGGAALGHAQHPEGHLQCRLPARERCTSARAIPVGGNSLQSSESNAADWLEQMSAAPRRQGFMCKLTCGLPSWCTLMAATADAQSCSARAASFNSQSCHTVRVPKCGTSCMFRPPTTTISQTETVQQVWRTSSVF